MSDGYGRGKLDLYEEVLRLRARVFVLEGLLQRFLDGDEPSNDEIRNVIVCEQCFNGGLIGAPCPKCGREGYWSDEKR